MAKRSIFGRLKDKFADTFQRYPILTTLFFGGILAGGIFYLTQHPEIVNREEEQIEDVHVDDTLALNIMCTQTLECLPFYHALESGLCDTLHLSLGIITQNSQMDIDSIMRRTKTVDGAVMDTYRLAHYRKTKNPLNLKETIPLCGMWRLVTCGQLRIKDIEKLKKRIVATARRETSSVLLEQAINGKDLKLADLYHAQINDIVIRTNMLDENQIDAAILPEPMASLAVTRDHRVVWSKDNVTSASLCFRQPVFKDARKQDQIELLRKVYNEAARDLNEHGTHAADSALIKRYNLPKACIDTLSLPKYKLL